MHKKIFLLIIMMFTFFSLSFAGELISKEAEGYYCEGVKAQKGGDFATAQIYYSKTLLVDPHNIDWQKFIANNRGVIYALQGDLDKAEATFKEALRLDPTYITPRLNLGFIYEKRRSRLESIEYWLNVLDINLDKIKPKGFVIEETQESDSN